jgi:hypothetical protein
LDTTRFAFNVEIDGFIEEPVDLLRVRYDFPATAFKINGYVEWKFVRFRCGIQNVAQIGISRLKCSANEG